MNAEPLQFNGVHLLVSIAALFLGFCLGMIFGYLRGEERGRGRWR